MSTTKRFRTGTAVAAAAATVVAGLSLGGAPATAARPAPNTAISDDGAVTTAPEAATNGVHSYAGTGRANASARTGDDGAARAKPMSGGGQETIIGADNRTLVNPTTSFPARAVTLITFSTGNGSSRCSGWLINKDTAVTAGHCLAPGGTGNFYPISSYRIYPGRNGSSSPFGVCTARRLHSVVGWVNSRLEEYDYGAIKLNCTVGNTTGWFGFWWQSANLSGQTIINGYPGDKPLTQWRSLDVVRANTVRQTFYQNDTVGGVSGSPVYQFRQSGSPFCTGFCSMAIHAYGLHGAAPHGTNNHGTRITQAVFNNLINWRNAP